MLMDNKFTGACLCGGVHFEIVGKFDRFYLCHCEYCRKDSGSAHAANLFSSTAALKWLTGEDRVKPFTLAGTRHGKAFCTTCGSALPSLQMQGRLLVVPAGSLNGPLAIRPTSHLFMASKADWDVDLENVPKAERLPI